MKNTNKGYTVNFLEEVITITKAFATKAGTYGTPEFNELVGLRAAYPNFKIEYKSIKKKDDKVSYKGLSIERMIAFIQIKYNKDAAMDFCKYIKVHEGEKEKYPIIKKMFLAKYKDEYKSLTVDEKMAIDVLAKSITKEFAHEDNKAELAEVA